jgi:hypothetical protein
MKKFGLLGIVLLALVCIQLPSFAQIRVLGDTSDTPIDSEGAVANDPLLPSDGKPDVREPYDPYKYINELRAKTLDEYADQVSENIHASLQASGGELLISVTEYTIPSVEVIKANFFAQVQAFGYDNVTPETNLGDFVDRAAQGILAKIACLSDIERRMVGIYYLADQQEEQGKSLAMQIVWTLESLTGQKFYNELYSLLDKYMKWPTRDYIKEPAEIELPTGDAANYQNSRTNSTKQERN